MIAYLEFEKEYKRQVKKLVVKIMKEELNIRSSVIHNITKDLKKIQKEYINDGGNFWIALDEEKNMVIGTVAVKNLENNKCEFKRFYVHKDYRNHGVGTKLYNIANSFIKEKGFKEAYLVSGEKSTQAQHIYIKDGWAIIDKDNEKANVKVRDGVELFKKVLE